MTVLLVEPVTNHLMVTDAQIVEHPVAVDSRAPRSCRLLVPASMMHRRVIITVGARSVPVVVAEFPL